jgi:beta-glucanase (GH16 family)
VRFARRRVVSTAAGTMCAVALAVVPKLDSTSPQPAPRPVGSAGGTRLLFSDEFGGTTVAPATWHTCAWWATSTCSIESNQELELYTKDNVSVAGGVLTLQARRQDAVGWNGRTYRYTSGMVSTGGRNGGSTPGFTYRYGYAEAQVRLPSGAGLWPAFWMLPADHSWPPEIDAMEALGEAPDVVGMNYHYVGADGLPARASASWIGPDFSAGWHTFGVDWEPDALVWYVDGIERMRFTDASAITAEPSYLVLDLAVGGTSAGAPDASTPLPGDYLVDYVRVWTGFGTPLSP